MSHAAISKRLSGYWKMEAANVFIIPGTVLFLAITLRLQFGLVTLAVLLPVCILLAIGTHYWRAKLGQLRDGGRLPAGIGVLARLQMPSLAITLAAMLLAGATWIRPELAVSNEDRWAATIFAILAALEYVNYYHRQLQHFDHWPDWKRLWAGKGFRKSQMAADIARWRALK